MKLTIALIQINSGPDMAFNIARLEKLVSEAASGGAQFVALPENVFHMAEPTGCGKRQLYAQNEHPGIQATAEMARRYKMWILVGSAAVKVDESGKSVNQSLLFDDSGTLISSYNKIHLFDVELANGEKYVESDRMLPGHAVALAKTPWVGLGLTICYDVRFPHLYRALAKAGADMIAVPAAFTATTGEAHWHVLLRARAIENGCYIIAPGQCGTHPGNRKTYGHSLIVDPWGKIIAEAGNEETVVIAEIDMAMVQNIRATLPSLKHDRAFT